MLSAMFNSLIPVKLMEDGSVFIDRDGKQFNRILNYLRNGTIEPPRDRAKAYDLLKEAEFYQLQSLVEILKEHLLSEVGSPMYFKKTGKVGKQVTVIKTETEKEMLLKATPDPILILEVSSSSFGDEKVQLFNTVLTYFSSGCHHLQAPCPIRQALL